MPQWNLKHNLVTCLIFFLSMIGDIAANPALDLPQVIPAESAFRFTLEPDQTTLQAHWEIAEQCYLYQNSIQIRGITVAGETFSLLPKQLPPATKIEDPNEDTQYIYTKQLALTLKLPAQILKQEIHTASIQVEYQGCAASGFCYPPFTHWFELTIKDGHIAGLEPKKTNFAAVDDQSENLPIVGAQERELKSLPFASKGGIVGSIATFYVIGLLLTFTPCMWPMIPILAGIIVGQAHLNTRKAFWLSLCYVLSMAFTYALAGVIAATLGKNLQASLQSPLIIISFAALFALLGVMQLGVVRITLPPQLRIKDILQALHAKQESGTYMGAAMMGIFAALISSPCVTPALIGVLSYISHSGNRILGGTALLAMGFGMGTFLLLIGTLGGKFLPRSGPWMHHVNQVFAIIMFGLSLWLLDRLFHGPWLLVLWGILSLFIAWCMNTFKVRTGWSGRIGMIFVFYAVLLFWGAYVGEQEPLNIITLNRWTQSSENEALITPYRVDSVETLTNVQQEAQQKGRPMVLVFYADWCVSCKHMEHHVFTEKSVQNLLKGVVFVQADVTSYNEQAQALLNKYGLIGPPVVLFFDKKGNELTNNRIIGEISDQEFVERLKALTHQL